MHETLSNYNHFQEIIPVWNIEPNILAPTIYTLSYATNFIAYDKDKLYRIKDNNKNKINEENYCRKRVSISKIE